MKNQLSLVTIIVAVVLSGLSCERINLKRKLKLEDITGTYKVIEYDHFGLDPGQDSLRINLSLEIDEDIIPDSRRLLIRRENLYGWDMISRSVIFDKNSFKAVYDCEGSDCGTLCYNIYGEVSQDLNLIQIEETYDNCILGLFLSTGNLSSATWLRQ